MTTRPIQIGDIVRYGPENREWQVVGRSHRPDGVYLLLASGEESERARPAECVLVGSQLEMQEQP